MFPSISLSVGILHLTMNVEDLLQLPTPGLTLPFPWYSQHNYQSNQARNYNMTIVIVLSAEPDSIL